MIKLYVWDYQGVYAYSVDADPAGVMPMRSTLQAPPDTSGAEVAQWTGAGWRVLPERPPAALID